MWTQLKQTAARIRAFSRTSDLDRDLEDELESHVTMLAEDHIRRGMTPDQAEHSARLELGGLTQLREAHRERQQQARAFSPPDAWQASQAGRRKGEPAPKRLEFLERLPAIRHRAEVASR
jgi:hypothetical protein